MTLIISRHSAIRAAALLSLAWRDAATASASNETPHACAIYERAVSRLTGLSIHPVSSVDDSPLSGGLSSGEGLVIKQTIMGLGGRDEAPTMV
jgi:hypothetical protein